MREPSLSDDSRGALQYPDVIMAFATFVSILVISPWLYAAIDMLQAEVDPLTGVLVGVTPALLVIALLLSIGVSARS